jgi:hypothetical protein
MLGMSMPMYRKTDIHKLQSLSKLQNLKSTQCIERENTFEYGKSLRKTDVSSSYHNHFP